MSAKANVEHRTLVIGHWSLDIGHWTLVIGHWSLDIGHWTLVIVSLFIALSLAYSLNSPLYEPTDELRHFRYARHIAVYHSLPVQSVEGPRAQSHHPPLYYALGALVSGWVDVAQDVYYEPTINPHWDDRVWEVSSDNKNQYLHSDDVGQFGKLPPLHGVVLAVYLVRWMTILIGASVVWFTYLIGREVFPERPALAVGGAALVAFNPQFIYLSGAVNNDIPAALCGAAVLLACVRLVQRGPTPLLPPSRGDKRGVTLGLLYGLALLTKLHLAALLVPIELAYVLALWRARDGSASLTGTWRAFLRGNLIILGLAAAISGWWFGRNLMLYGDLTGMSRVNELWAGRSPAGNWWAIRQGLPYLWSSLWGRFGYGQLPLPQIIYRSLLCFCALALAGYLIPRRDSLSTRALALLVAAVLIFTVVVCYYILIQPAGAMGRFLFPALPAFAILLMGGLSRFIPRRLTWAASLTVTLGMAALAVYALAGVLSPAFARPRPLTESEIKAAPNPTNIEFGVGPPPSGEDERGVARLLGYRVAPTTVEPGGAVEVTVYWQALARPDQNYIVFVHLLSDVGVMVAQRDTHPGLGSYPTTAWEPGVAFADTYRLHVPETAYAPDTGYVQVGLYLPGGPRLATPAGRDALRLAEVEIRPRPGELPNPLDVNFDGQIMLVSYDLDRRVARPGETVRLTLYWRPLVSIDGHYRVFAHILGGEDQVWANSDSPLTSEAVPAGQIIEDIRDLTVGLTTPPGFYDIEVGLHVGGDRLPVVAEDGHWLGGRVLLSKIRVASE
ncbi:MAG: glycosyltransferase family 39 protein [Chloroflexota bacterium]|nr:glycosyltransferase family 39 protein [Chloroflexota bacterium]